MSLSNAQRSGFDDRLKRIQKGGANTMGELHLGPVDEERARNGKGKGTNTGRLKKKKGKKVDLNGGGSTVTLAPLGVLLGGLAMFVGQAINYQLFHETGLFGLSVPVEALTPYMQYAPFLFGGIFALMFVWTFRLNTPIRFAAVGAGFVAAFVYQIAIMKTVPFMYVGFFSKEFVKATLSAGV